MSEITHIIPSSLPRFDYESVACDIADKLRDRASRISSLNAKATETILAIGRELVLAKAQIDHGDFECWVETEALISIRAAQNYMAVARFAEHVTLERPGKPPLKGKQAQAEVVEDWIHAGKLTDQQIGDWRERGIRPPTHVTTACGRILGSPESQTPPPKTTNAGSAGQ
jgi:hypothetical protein